MDDKSLTIISRGRSGSTIAPNHRIEDAAIDAYAFRIALWIKSHTNTYRDDVSQNEIARVLKISRDKVANSLKVLAELKIIEIERGQKGQRIRVIFDHDTWEIDANPISKVAATRPLSVRLAATKCTPGGHIDKHREEHLDLSLSADEKNLSNSDIRNVEIHFEQFKKIWSKSTHPICDTKARHEFVNACRRERPETILAKTAKHVDNYDNAKKSGMQPTYMLGAARFLAESVYDTEPAYYDTTKTNITTATYPTKNIVSDKLKSIENTAAFAKFCLVSMRFEKIYGRLWTCMMGKTIDEFNAIAEEWSEQLNNFPNEILVKALDVIVSGKSDFSKFPPTAIKFKIFCQQFAKKSETHKEIKVKKNDDAKKEAQEDAILDKYLPNWREKLENRKDGELWAMARHKLLQEATKLSVF